MERDARGSESGEDVGTPRRLPLPPPPPRTHLDVPLRSVVVVEVEKRGGGVSGWERGMDNERGRGLRKRILREIEERER